MSKRKKQRKQKMTPPTLEGGGISNVAQSEASDQTALVVCKDGDSVRAAVTQGVAGHDGWASRWFASFKTAREFIVAVTAVVALVISTKSCITARESLGLSRQQAEANQRYHQEHVKPDVRAFVRHSSSEAYRDNPMAAELVVWNNGPIKAVSLTGTYRVYVLNSNDFHVIASMGVSQALVDYSFSLPEFKPTGEYVKPILSASSPTLYVVNLVYYRETDMERYSTENYFLFEDGAFYDRESFKGRTNYNALMSSLLFKMRCEAQGDTNKYRVVDPPLPGASHLNFNVLNVLDADSPEWGPIISNKTSEIAADPRNPAGYVGRGTSFHLMHKLAEAASDYERAIELGTTNSQCYNNLAGIRSTSTNAVLRNGGQAVKLAKRACELTGWKSWRCLANLAAAYAETGDFGSAIKYEREVITLPGLLPLEREAEERALARMLDHLPVREGL